MGPKIKAWNPDRPLSRRRSRGNVHDDILDGGVPRVVASRSSTRVPSEDDAAVRVSNIHLAKIYAQTDLALAAATQAPPTPRRRAPHPALQHLPTCPCYDGPRLPQPGDDAKTLETLFTSKAAERATGRAAAWTGRAHKDYLAQLSEYVRSISKGPGVATVIRNELREPAPEKQHHKRQPAQVPGPPDAVQPQNSPRLQGPKSRDRPRGPAQLTDAPKPGANNTTATTTTARHRAAPAEGTRTPHRKDTCSR